jgi:hypothetical protein
MFGFGFGAARQRFVGSVALPPALSAIAADGWRATVDSPSDLSLTPFTATRAGFDATGTATTFADILHLTKRVRQVFPDQASLTATDVALSDYVYLGDLIAGAVNNSTEVSPKPVLDWIMPDRRVVGDFIDWEIAAFHRDARLGKTSACVQVRATDGTNVTPWQTESEMTISGRVGDRVPVVRYGNRLDISALNNLSLITLQRRGFPHFGSAASVLDIADVNNARQTATRLFWKDTAIATAPIFAYVAVGGSDAVVITSGFSNPATAAASPFATVAGAMTALHVFRGAAGIDGCIIRIGSGSFALTGPAATRNQRCGALIIERDPNVARTDAVLTWGNGTGFRPRLGGVLVAGIATGAIVLRDVTLARQGTNSTVMGEAVAPLEVDFEDVSLNTTGVTTNYVGTNVQRIDICGMALIGLQGVSAFAGGTGTTGGHRLMRGIHTMSAVAGCTMERWCMVGCELDGVAGLSKVGTRDDDSGLIVAFNRFVKLPMTSNFLTVTAATVQTFTGVIVTQNLFEAIGTTGNNALAISADNDTASIVHLIVHHNTLAGFDTIGRANIDYDESAGTVRRTHRLHSIKGNIFVRNAIKGDIFVGIEGGAPAEAPFRNGNFAVLHGVGLRGNFHQWASGERYEYYGPDSSAPASTGIREVPGFVSDQATVSASVAGAGGGDYALTGGAAARGRVDELLLPFDMAGVARVGTQAAGAWA